MGEHERFKMGKTFYCYSSDRLEVIYQWSAQQIRIINWSYVTPPYGGQGEAMLYRPHIDPYIPGVGDLYRYLLGQVRGAARESPEYVLVSRSLFLSTFHIYGNFNISRHQCCKNPNHASFQR